MFQTDIIPMPDLAENTESATAAFNSLKDLSLDDAIAKIANSIVDFGFKLFIAILVLYVGKFIIKKLYRMVHNVMINRHVDASLTTFVLSLVRMLLYFILIITIVGILGIETSSFLALFASAGVAIGMALSGTLQNFAGGVLILLLKPYKVGDYIEAQGFAGTVKEIQIFHTVINTPDNKAIIIPNGGLSTSSINNYSLESYRRVDWTIGLTYGNDSNAAREAILKILLSDARVVEEFIEDDMSKRLQRGDEKAEVADDSDSCDNGKDSDSCAKKENWWIRMLNRRKQKRAQVMEEQHRKEMVAAGIPVKVSRKPFVGLNELGDSSVNYIVRAWTHSSNYWPLYFEMNERFYNELPALGFEFPFPQLDVHFDSAGLSVKSDSIKA